MGYLDELQNQAAYQGIPGPQLQVKGEVPYGVPKENILARIRRKLGDDRIAGLIGALTMPEGRIDQTGQRTGYSPFQAGLAGYQGGVQGYRDRQAAQLKAQADSDLAEREIAVKEQNAETAEQRAGYYGEWARRPQRTSVTRQTLPQKVEEYMGLSPEQKAAATEAGFVGRRGRGAGNPTNQEQQVQSLMAEFEGLSEDEARIIITQKPTILSTGTEYDLSGFRKNKKVTLRNRREYGVSRQVKRILARHGFKPEDVYGFVSAQEPTFPNQGPQTSADLQDMSEEEVSNLLQSIPPGSLDPEQIEMFQQRLDELEEQGMLEGMEDEGEELPPFAPVPSHRRSY